MHPPRARVGVGWFLVHTSRPVRYVQSPADLLLHVLRTEHRGKGWRQHHDDWLTRFWDNVAPVMAREVSIITLRSLAVVTVEISPADVPRLPRAQYRGDNVA
jgi:hypothetical protein